MLVDYMMYCDNLFYFAHDKTIHCFEYDDEMEPESTDNTMNIRKEKITTINLDYHKCWGVFYDYDRKSPIWALERT